ncbi:MAG: hypothetical protein RLZZ11_117 [Cyanobacteriota bacterium]|jgi:hypothetical protein
MGRPYADGDRLASAGDTRQRPLRLHNFLHTRVIGVQPSLTATALRPTALQAPTRLALPRQKQLPFSLAGALLVALPVFLQAPWVRLAPFSAALFTAPLLLLGALLAFQGHGRWRDAGALLVGFSGSWLGGCLFWGWFRLHPLWHLPIEAFALPLALGGLRSRWRLAASFYLASLLGTACTDGVMALTGVMQRWTEVLNAPLDQAALLLHQAALQVMQPFPLAITLLAGALLIQLCRRTWQHPDPAWRLAASAVATTLAVDGLFLAAALWAPRLSGLI